MATKGCPVHASSDALGSPVVENGDGIESDDCIELVVLYIRLIHDKPHTLFHPPTLLRQAKDGSLPRHVLFAILSMAARLSDRSMLKLRAAEFLQTAKTLTKQQIDLVVLENVQACVLIGNLCGVDGNYQAETLWYGFAFKMAEIMCLPQPDDAVDDAVTRELHIRVWWSLYMIDRWSSAGHGRPRQFSNECHSPLPMDEIQFHALPQGRSPSESEDLPLQPGLWAQMVRLASIFALIQDVHRQYAEHADGRVHAETETHRLAGELDAFLRQLPEHATLSEDNLKRHAAQGLGSTFVALHLGFHHYATLLYFPFLDLQLEHTETHLFVSRCKLHAAAFSDLLQSSCQVPGCDAVYPIVAHMAVVSSAALLHTLLFGGDAELPQTRRRLESNFQTMVRLRQYWPSVAHLMDRLFTFQRACIWSADPNTHKIDRWMVRFLLNHTLPVPEKAIPAEDLGLVGSDDNFQQRGRAAGEALSILRPNISSPQ